MNADGYFPYTPPTRCCTGCAPRSTGSRPRGWTSHRPPPRLAEGVRRGVAAWGLDLRGASALCSDTVSAIRCREGVDAREVLRIAYDEYNTSLRDRALARWRARCSASAIWAI
jgi:alanine-glyoxylate transaminase / serine-glyoxylate transaminase / serine-pyruvate transaminase